MPKMNEIQVQNIDNHWNEAFLSRIRNSLHCMEDLLDDKDRILFVLTSLLLKSQHEHLHRIVFVSDANDYVHI